MKADLRTCSNARIHFFGQLHTAQDHKLTRLADLRCRPVCKPGGVHSAVLSNALVSHQYVLASELFFFNGKTKCQSPLRHLAAKRATSRQTFNELCVANQQSAADSLVLMRRPTVCGVCCEGRQLESKRFFSLSRMSLCVCG